MIRETAVKSILNKHKKRDDWFLDDYSINPYFGCSFNCVYCYVHGSKYGTDTAVPIVKKNAPQILEKQLLARAKRKEFGIILISSSTEPYMQIEKKLEITRTLLKIILKHKFPVHILTKSTLVIRDIDILKRIDENAILPDDLKEKLSHGAIISFSLSTLDSELANKLEPGAPSPIERLEAMKKLRDEGLLAGVSYIPVLPFISDTEEQLDNMIKVAKRYNAAYIFVGALTLFGNKPSDCKTRYYKFLEKYYPTLIPEYKKLFRVFTQPPRKYQLKLEQIAKKLCEKYGVKYKLI